MFWFKKETRTQNAIVLDELSKQCIPISSNYFVYDLGIARISARIYNLREKGNTIYTLYDKRKNRHTVYYLLVKNKDDMTEFKYILATTNLKMYNK